MGLFKPYWMISDKDKVFNVNEKVRNETDPNILANIAKNAPSFLVREAAVRNKNMTDQILLADIALNDTLPVCKEAVIKLTNQTLLTDVVKKSRVSNVREAGVGRVTDQSVLADIARNDDYGPVRAKAVKNVTEQSVLSDIAKTDSYWGVRAAVAEKLADRSLLADIAKNDSNIEVRRAAVGNENLTNHPVLVDIATNDYDTDMRMAAVKKITNQSMLEDIAKNAQNVTDYLGREQADYETISIAIERLTNPSVLMDIAKSDGDLYKCCCAFKELYILKNLQDVEIFNIFKVLFSRLNTNDYRACSKLLYSLSSEDKEKINYHSEIVFEGGMYDRRPYNHISIKINDDSLYRKIYSG